MRRISVVVAAFALFVTACSSGGSSATPTTTVPATTAATTTVAPTTTTTTTSPPPTTTAEFAGTIELSIDNPGRCEFIGDGCMLPFPSDYMTVADSSTPTGRRVNISTASMPANSDGVNVDTAHFNLNDGFSPGAAGLVLIPGLDPVASNLPPVTNIAASLEPDSVTVVIDATTGERWPHWAEIDSNAPPGEDPGLFIRPAKNYTNGDRIVIGIRNLVDKDGNAIEPTDAFRAYRDRLKSNVPEVEARRPAMEQVFSDLEAAGVARDDLVIAWDFTVISTENLTGPLLAMRDDAFAQLGDAAPKFTVDTVTREDDRKRRVIEGTYEVPLYLTGDGSPGQGLNLIDGAELPTQNGTFTASYRCQISDTTTPDKPGAGVVYGHGLLGDIDQVTSAGPSLIADNFGYVICGTRLIGMADPDTGNAIAALSDFSRFYTLADRLLQGHLNTLFLGRLMKNPEGFVADPAFRSADDRPLLNTDQLYYYGISQGGIMGPVTTAVSFDWDRGVFGVPGVNYSTLLNRSVDFNTFQLVLDPAYPNKLDQAILLLAAQMLWDRGEGNGYVNYFTNPLPGVNEKVGLLQLALGDHQVTNVAANVMARSMGASVHWPAYAKGRTLDVEPFWNIPRIDSYPFRGSATVMFDSGAAIAPTTNTPPSVGEDPHEDVRRAAAAYDQIAAFLQPDGVVIDTCNGGPCIIAPRS